jgi:hypothetical protein
MHRIVLENLGQVGWYCIVKGKVLKNVPLGLNIKNQILLHNQGRYRDYSHSRTIIEKYQWS